MFASTMLSISLLAASASALTINTPSNWMGNATNAVTWTSTPSDPTAFSIELVNTQFNPSIGVANSIQTSLGSVGIPLPRLTAGDGFTLQFVGVSNITDILAMSSPFSITENDVDGASSTSGASSLSAASTVAGTPGGSASAPATSATAPVTSAATTDTTLPTSTSDTGSSTSASDTAAPTTLNGGASHSASVSVLLAGFAGLMFLAN